MLCKALSAARTLPYHMLDKIQWKPNWVRVPDDDFRAAHDRLLAQGRWLIDGHGPWFAV